MLNQEEVLLCANRSTDTGYTSVTVGINVM